MPIESFLNRLHKVRPKGKGKWLALCPCHNEKTPSLAISDDNGVVLMHCFGCGGERGGGGWCDRRIWVNCFRMV